MKPQTSNEYLDYEPLSEFSHFITESKKDNINKQIESEIKKLTKKAFDNRSNPTEYKKLQAEINNLQTLRNSSMTGPDKREEFDEMNRRYDKTTDTDRYKYDNLSAKDRVELEKHETLSAKDRELQRQFEINRTTLTAKDKAQLGLQKSKDMKESQKDSIIYQVGKMNEGWSIQ